MPLPGCGFQTMSNGTLAGSPLAFLQLRWYSSESCKTVTSPPPQSPFLQAGSRKTSYCEVCLDFYFKIKSHKSENKSQEGSWLTINSPLSPKGPFEQTHIVHGEVLTTACWQACINKTPDIVQFCFNTSSLFSLQESGGVESITIKNQRFLSQSFNQKSVNDRIPKTKQNLNFRPTN